MGLPSEPFTDRGLLQSIPCRGEKYHEMTAPGGNIKYMISTQEEQLTQTLYDAIKHEIANYAGKRELMTAEMEARLQAVMNESPEVTVGAGEPRS